MGKGSVGNRYGQQLRKSNQDDNKMAKNLKLALLLYGLTAPPHFRNIDTYVSPKTEKRKMKNI
jgi:hypothetical protein